MKVLMINGSPHKEGNTYIALHEMEKIFRELSMWETRRFVAVLRVIPV